MKEFKFNTDRYYHEIDIVYNPEFPESGKALKIKTTHYMTVAHYLTETEMNMTKYPLILIEETMKYNEERLRKKAIELGFESDDEMLLSNEIHGKEFIV